jgi:hypothetical protein
VAFMRPVLAALLGARSRCRSCGPPAVQREMVLDRLNDHVVDTATA